MKSTFGRDTGLARFFLIWVRLPYNGSAAAILRHATFRVLVARRLF